MSLPASIETKIRALRRLLRELIIIAGASRVALAAVVLAAFCLVVDWQFRLPPGWRLALAFGALGGIAAAGYWFLVRPLRVEMPDAELALLFERRFPELSDVLVSAVQLAVGGSLGSPDLVAAVIRGAESAAGQIEPRRVPRLRPVNRLAFGAVAALLIAGVFVVAYPASARTFAVRFINPFGPTQWPRATELELEVAGSRGPLVTVARGDQVGVKVTALNARNSSLWSAPQTVWLDYQLDSGVRESRPMRRIEGPTYQAYFNDIAEGLTLRARTGETETAPVRVKIVQLPRVEDIWVSLQFPAYTRLSPQPPSRSLTEVRALAGTRVKVDIRTSLDVPDGGARMIVDPTGPSPMHRQNRPEGADGIHQGEFVLAAGMKWFRIELTDTSGLRDQQPRTFQLQVLEDKPPRVRIVKPGGETRCTPYAALPLEISIKDDLAARSAWLRYALGPKEKPEQKPLELKNADSRTLQDVTIACCWDISELGVKVGQSVFYRAEADDFRDLFPPGSNQTRQVGSSEEYVIKIVSPADLASELDRLLFALRGEVKKDKTREEEDRRKVLELLRKIAEGQPLTNDDRSLAADAENVQRELARSEARIAQEIARVRDRMQDNRVGSFADRRRLDEVKATLDAVAATDMPRAAEFVRAARKDLASREGRDNLQAASGIQANVIAQLEKVLASMSHNEDIDNLVRAARELLRKQQAILAETGDFAKRPGTFGAPPTELQPADLAALNLLVRSQNAARDDMRNLEQDMLSVFERLKEEDPRRAELVRQAQLQASRDQVRLLMEEAAAKLSGNQTGLAASNQESAIKGLERLLEFLEQARQESGGNEAIAQAIQDVKKALQQVQRLLKQQQGHAADIAEVNRNAEQAKRLKQLRRLIENLRKDQDNVSGAARDKDRLKELTDQERKLGETATGLRSDLNKEAEDAASRQAAQAADIRSAADSTAAAQSKMNSAQDRMHEGDPSKAAESGKEASDKLGEADRHLADALDAIEKKRLDDTREAALKQGDTRKQADDVLRQLQQLAKDNESISKEASDGLQQAGGKVGESGQSMEKAQSNLDRNDTVQGEEDAKTARDRLADAQDILEKLRDRLEAKQKEQKILDLLVELQPMLEKQIEINGETRRIDAATAQANLPEPSRPDKVRLGQLAADESRIATKADELLRKVEGENAPVFVWGFRRIVKDMTEVKDRLVACNTDSYTQDLEKDIADTLRMLIDALKREQSRMRDGGEGDGGGGGGGGGKPMLVPPSAQLKLLKARELEIHNNTKRLDLKRLVNPDKVLSALEQKRVKRLAEEQAELGDLTTKLAEALERELQEYQKKAKEGP